MFNGSTSTTIHGRSFYNARDQNDIYHYGGVYRNLDDSVSVKTLKLLAHNAAPNACYDPEQRFPPPNCHPGTRTRILNELSHWIEDKSKTTRAFWVYGSGGVGKTAIAQDLAAKYVGKRVAATFFFSRNDSTRDKLDPFVASLAYQFCRSGSPLRPVLGPLIVEAIRAFPNILRTPFERQFQHLIIQPCSRVKRTKLEVLPNTIIIDALDECVDHSSQETLLRIIRVTAALRSPESPVPWVFLIFSHPEPQLDDSFRDFGAILRRFNINSSDGVYRDIYRYYTNQFAILRRKHHHTLRSEGTSWPSDNAIHQLVNRADQKFIFATTVIKYIDTYDERPQDRLNTILRIYAESESKSPYSDLDILYRQILSTCRRWEKFQPVLRLLVTPHRVPTSLIISPWQGVREADQGINWRSPEIIALFFNLPVETALSPLHSVLRIPEDIGFNNNNVIRIAHASFTEFLSDPNRSGKYYTPGMSDSEYFEFMATQLVRIVLLPLDLARNYPPYRSQSDFTTIFSQWGSRIQAEWSHLTVYSCTYWVYYVVEVKSPRKELLEVLGRLDPYSFTAASMFRHQKLDLFCWFHAIVWAKSKSQHLLAKKWWTFLRGFRVAFPPLTSHHQALWWTFDWEHILTDNIPMNSFQITFLRKVYAIEEAATLSNPKDHAVLVLPTDSCQTPPAWTVTQITRNSGEVFMRVSNALQPYADGVKVLVDDILNDTCKTVLHGLVKEADLTYLKLLLKERAGIFGVPFRPRTINS